MRHRFRCAGVLLACLTCLSTRRSRAGCPILGAQAGHDWPGWLVDSAQAIARVRAVGPIGPAPGADTSAGSGTMAFAVLEDPRAGRRAPPPPRGRWHADGAGRLQRRPRAVHVRAIRRRARGCFASRYRVGAEYLLLLRRDPDDQSLSPYWAGLAPVDEQVRGTRDAWVGLGTGGGAASARETPTKRCS